MLGNDVVDLADPETRSRHAGFDARVFGPCERDAIAAAPDPHALRQMLWAAKESAYKAARRRDRGTVFSPVRFQVVLGADGRGRVLHPDVETSVRVTRHGDCVHAIARIGDAAAPGTSGCADVRGEAPGRVARSLALDALSESLGLPREALEIRRQQRIPELTLHGRPLGIPLSLSHHGRYAAYAALTHASWRTDP